MKKWIVLAFILIALFANHVIATETRLLFEDFENETTSFTSIDNNGSGAKWGRINKNEADSISFPEGLLGNDEFYAYCSGVGYDSVLTIWGNYNPKYISSMSTQLDNNKNYNVSNELYDCTNAVYLEFWYNIPSIDGSIIGESHDRLELYLSFNGSAEKIWAVDTPTDPNSFGGWEHKKIDIRSFINGESFKVGFYFHSDASHEEEGVYIDKIGLSYVSNLSPPNLISPSDGNMSSNTKPLFDWSSVSTATSYELLVDNNTDFGSPEIHELNITSNSFSTNIDLSSDTYYWKVKSINGDVASDFSSVSSFTITSALNLNSYLDNSTYEPSSSAKLTVELTDYDGNPISGANISMLVDGGSSLSLGESTPAGTYVRWFVTPSSSGLYNIAITAIKSGYEVETSSISLNVQEVGEPGHDIRLLNPSVRATSPGNDVNVNVDIHNLGIYTEANIPINFYLYDPSNNLIDTGVINISSIDPSVHLYDLSTVSMQTTSSEGYYTVKIHAVLDNDYDQSNNLLEIATWVGGDLDFDSYKTEPINLQDTGDKISSGNYSVELVQKGTTAIIVNIFRGSSEIEHNEILKIEDPTKYDNEQLLLVYDAYHNFGSFSLHEVFVGEGIVDVNNQITPPIKTIDLGEQAVFNVKTTDNDPNIVFPKWDENSNDAGAIIDSWSWNETNYSPDDSDYDFVITPPTSASISTYSFWVRFCDQGGYDYFQRLKLTLHAPHDIEVINVSNPSEVHIGEVLNVESILRNSGGYDETSIRTECKLTDSATNEIISNQYLDLTINSIDTLQFGLNVTNIDPGSYDLIVTASINNDLFPSNNEVTIPITVLPMKELSTTPLIVNENICIGQFLELEHNVLDDNSNFVENAQVFAKVMMGATELNSFICELDTVSNKYIGTTRLQNSGDLNLIVTSMYEGFATANDTINFYSMAIPYNLQATVITDDIDLNWEFNEVTKKNHTGYKLYRDYAWIADINDLAQHQYTDLDLSFGRYVYQVSATYSDPVTESLFSDSLIVKIDGEIVVNTLTPSIGTTSINETDSINFVIDAYDPDGNLIDYRWKLDGNTIGYDNSLTMYSDYNQNPGMLTSGNYALTLDITDNFQSKNTLNYQWDITVNDVNRAPSIVSFLPEEQDLPVYNVEPEVTFEISATDPDIDNTLNYTWLIDTSDQAINDSTFLHTFTENGGYTITAIVSDGVATDSTVWNVTSYVGIDEFTLPKQTQLHQNYPNPFNPETTISFDLAKQSNVNISVFNYNGSLVRKLVDDTKNAGRHTVNWNGKDAKGSIVTTGMYFVVMKTANYSKVIKALMVK